MKLITKLYQAAYAFLLIPHLILYYLSNNRNIINEDLSRWSKEKNKPGSNIKLLLYFLTNSPDFRSIFYFRTRGIIAAILKIYCRKEKYFIIDQNTKLGGGIVTAHPYSTILNAESIGTNLYVNHLVTVGEIDGKRPTIGNNVKLYANCTVIGGISIGDNVTIGAGSVVTKSIPKNSVVVGNPARIIKTMTDI